MKNSAAVDFAICLQTLSLNYTTCSSDIFNPADQQRVTLLALLDLSAAFDCVDHHILLQRLEGTVGLSGRVTDWIRSFLTDRTQRAVYDGRCSLLVHLLWRVPKATFLGHCSLCCTRRRCLTELRSVVQSLTPEAAKTQCS